MDLKDRLQQIIIRNGLNASAFADSLNIQRSNLSHILSGRNKPSIDFIEKFINKFPNENIIWLITGANNDIQKTKIQEKISENSNLLVEHKNEPIKSEGELFKPKVITKIITFYNDNTFEIYHPNS